MVVIAINGSPRKKGNTAELLNKAIEGAKSVGAQTEIVNLYDLNYKGCVSCFACKLKNGKSYGRCAYRDEITPILNKISDADAVILASPIYFGDLSGEMRSFIERMVYPYLVYDKNYSSLFGRKMPIGLIYTMNVDENRLNQMGFRYNFDLIEMFMKRTFGEVETLLSTDTYQFDDYSKYECTAFDEEAKKQRKIEQFPKDCENAFNLGVKFGKMVHLKN